MLIEITVAMIGLVGGNRNVFGEKDYVNNRWVAEVLGGWKVNVPFFFQTK